MELPWDRRGHTKTSLKERCAAVCTWMEKVSVASIQRPVSARAVDAVLGSM